jgi:hypothetical protein
VTERLISADSHVAVDLPVIRERVPGNLHQAFDDAIAAQAAIDRELRGDRQMSSADFDMEAYTHPGYKEPRARLEAMDRDGVQAEVLYSEVSAFRSFGLVEGDWKPISRAFTDHLAEFASVDPDRLAVSYQVPVIDVPYAVAEVERLAALGARSVHLPNFPSEIGLPDYWDESYDPLWSVLQETGISISHHLGVRNWLFDVFRRDPTPQAAVFTSLPSLALAEVLGLWLLSAACTASPRSTRSRARSSAARWRSRSWTTGPDSRCATTSASRTSSGPPTSPIPRPRGPTRKPSSSARWPASPPTSASSWSPATLRASTTCEAGTFGG